MMGVLLGTSCGPGDRGRGSGSPEVVIVAELGYPRDLLERGRVNLVVTRPDDTPFTIVSKQLRATHFSAAPTERRTSAIPGNGRPIALQTLFGAVDECDDDAPVNAVLDIEFTTDDPDDVDTASLPLDDAAVLDDIRLQECVARRFLDENEIAFRDVKVGDETIALDLVVTRRTGDERLTLHTVAGTVLFGVESPTVQGSDERVLSPGRQVLVLPLLLDVNRCDPHAVAETTRKFGIDLWIAIGGEEPQRVPVPVGPLITELEALLERCTARADG